MKQRRYLLKIQYDGARFAGYQRQPGERTVQGELEGALSEVLGEKIALTCAGRTDKGVHGLGQVVRFKTSNHGAVGAALREVDAKLNPEIRIVGSVVAPAGFHPHHSAMSRTYSYFILCGTRSKVGSVLAGRILCLSGRPDIGRMRQAARLFKGKHDFSTFSYRSGRTGNVRRLLRIEIAARDDLICLQFQGEGFLRKMVRLLVSAIVECGLGLCEVSDLAHRLQARDPELAPHPAPPCGLYLQSVEYQPDPFG